MKLEDDACPFCWGTGYITVVEPTADDGIGKPVTRRCPEGCVAPGEVPF